MANSNTEHSKKLRAKHAAEYNKRMVAEGKIKPISLRLPAEISDEFVAILAEFGETRPKAVAALCEFVRQHRK
ncbi:hypothetical protein A4G18_07375 [Pasteurellaceae bacterium Pebbles2]|nr:hypothetical protein [Pasteurellaceae bacterium Pebbles2]